MRGAHALTLALLCALGGCDINSDEPPENPFIRPDVPFGGRTWHSDEAPPAISGGHLAVLPDGDLAAADPARRELVIVSTSPLAIRARHPLAGEPGRVVSDGSGAVHVVLRDQGAIASLDPASERMSTRAVCASPRGLAFDGETDSLFVTCLDGRVQRLPRAGGAAETIATLPDGDLRDVVPQPEGLWVTHFRSARVALLSREGSVLREVTIPPLTTRREELAASIAWRAVPQPGGGIVIAHQRHTNRTVSTVPMDDPSASDPSLRFPGGGGGGGYGGGFDPVTGECQAPLVSSAATRIDASGEVTWTGFTAGALPVDVAPHGDEVWVASAAVLDRNSSVAQASPVVSGETCLASMRTPAEPVGGQTLSVVWAGSTKVIQTQFPSGLWFGWERLSFDEGEGDVGHALFHANTSSNLACASCHPEGGEDGIRWSFFEVGSRRTQELRGGLLATAPFHWSGDRPGITDIMEDVFRGRMGGGAPTVEQMDAVGGWLDALPLPALDADETLAAQGHEVFTREGCADCHSGALHTNNEFADFGRGELQVPPLLGVSFRGPWMHDGCAHTLESTVIASCAGEEHSVALDTADVERLVAYLRTL